MTLNVVLGTGAAGGYIPLLERAQANGVATLDGAGRLVESQLPALVVVTASPNPIASLAGYRYNTNQILTTVNNASLINVEGEITYENTTPPQIGAAAHFSPSLKGGTIAGLFRVIQADPTNFSTVFSPFLVGRGYVMNPVGYAKGESMVLAEYDLAAVAVGLGAPKENQTITEGGKIKVLNSSDQEGFEAPTGEFPPVGTPQHTNKQICYAYIGGEYIKGSGWTGRHLVTYEKIENNELINVKGWTGTLEPNAKGEIVINCFSSLWTITGMRWLQTKHSTNIPVGYVLMSELEEAETFINAKGTKFLRAMIMAEGTTTGPLGIDYSSVSFLEAGIKLGTNKLLGTKSIGAGVLDTNSVEAVNLQSGAVTEAKLGASAVTTAKIAAEAVETAKIKLLAVTTALLAAEAVTEPKLAASAVSVASLSSAVNERFLQGANNLVDVANTSSALFNIGVPALKFARAVVTTNVASLSGVPAAEVTDGVLVATSQRVLLTKQTAESQNGPWTVNSGAWTRPLDFPNNEGVGPRLIEINSGGTNYGASIWLLSVATLLLIGTTAQTWIQIAPAPAEGITTAKLASEAVTEAKLAASAVTAGKIASETITLPKLASTVGTRFDWASGYQKGLYATSRNLPPESTGKPENKRLLLSRFVTPIKREIKSISFAIDVVGGATTDTIDLAVWSASALGTWTLLIHVGTKENYLAKLGTGKIEATFTLEPEVFYYLGMVIAAAALVPTMGTMPTGSKRHGGLFTTGLENNTKAISLAAPSFEFAQSVLEQATIPSTPTGLELEGIEQVPVFALREFAS